MNRIHLARDVSHLLREELVYLEPIRRIGMRKQVMNHVIHAEIRKPERGVIVVELERSNARRIGLKSQHQDICHQPHVLTNILRDAISRPSHIRFIQRRPPPLQLPFLTSVFDPQLHVAH